MAIRLVLPVPFYPTDPAKLPEAEREACSKFWADVDELECCNVHDFHRGRGPLTDVHGKVVG
jgi:hypothetical protein